MTHRPGDPQKGVLVNRTSHWDSVYSTKAETEVSWYQHEPRVSLELIRRVLPGSGGVIDMGGGASVLVDRLLDLRLEPVAVLDISSAALDRARARLKEQRDRVRWIVAGVTLAPDLGQYDLWHDGAVFHFLTAPEDRHRYVELASRTVPPGGHLVMATFAVSGPLRCSGLDVCRYDSASLAKEFGDSFTLVSGVQERHVTPAGKPRELIYCVFRRVERGAS